MEALLAALVMLAMPGDCDIEQSPAMIFDCLLRHDYPGILTLVAPDSR